VYWTALEGPGGWGLLEAGHYPADSSTSARLRLTKRFHAYGQYTRFIRPHATIYPVKWPSPASVPSGRSDGLRLVVAKNLDGQVIVVATNPSSRAQKLDLPLKGLSVTDRTGVVPYLTNASHDATADPAYAAAVHSAVLTATVPADTVATYLLASTPPPPPDLTIFAGQWHAHGGAITVTTTGQLTIEERTYLSCGQNPPPCDPTTGPHTGTGHMATGQLTTAHDNTAEGQITATNDPAWLATGPVLLRYTPTTDSIQLTGTGTGSGLTACGPRSPTGLCGA
jgi:hypothetical protein